MKKIVSKKGFTLLEVIIAVAVVAILAGIAIPSIVSANNSLSKKQANDYAKSIYLAAQDNLASLRTDGSLSTLLNSTKSSQSVYTEGGSLVDEVKAVLSAELQQALLEKDANHEYCYISNLTEDEYENFLPQGSIDSSILDQNIFIIFNPETGDVFYVKYGDKGEYNGSVVNKAEKLVKDEELVPNVYLFNGQEFLVKINVPIPEEYASASKAFYDAITFHITVSDAKDSTKAFSYDFKPSDSNEDFRFNYSSGEASWVLDSLRAGHSFADKCGGKIASGNDVTVSVEYRFDSDAAGGKEVVFDTASSVKTGNPLFASVKGNVISLTNGRNICNLAKIDAALASTFASDSAAEVKLTSDVAWGDTVGYYQNLKYDNVKNFAPLAAQKLFAAGSKLTFNGNGKSIINLYEKSASDAGLFADLRVAVKDLTLVDPIISGSGSCGALAGSASSALISNCKVVINSKSNITDAVHSGNEKPAAGTDIYGVVSTGNSSAGLLLGSAGAGTNITGCSVELGGFSMPASAGNFGLVAGQLNSSNIVNTVVNGLIEGGMANNVGLVAGYANNSGYSGVEVNGSIINTNATGGSIGALAGLLENCTVSAKSVNVSIDGVKSLNVGYVVGRADGGNISKVNAKGTVSDIANAYVGAIGYANGGTYNGITADSSFVTLSSSDIGGLVGRSSAGTYSNLNVTSKIGDDTVNGIVSCHVGGAIGYADCVKVNGSNSVSYTITNLDSCASVGGAVGLANNCVLTGVSANGTFSTISGSDLGGAVGTASSGTFSSLSVSANIGDGTANGIYGCNVGGVIGSSVDALLSNCPLVTINFKNFKNCSSTGGAVGYAEGGEYSNIAITGNMSNMVSCYFGGAVGSAIGGIFNGISCDANLGVEYVWLLGEGGPVPAEYGTYACPSSVGYAGRFVGYIESGSFTNCSATGTATSMGSHANYADMQFVGVVDCSTRTINTASNYFLPASVYSGYKNISYSEDYDTVKALMNASSAVNLSSVTAHSYNVSLENCKYTDAAGKANYQCFTDEGYYYAKTSSNVQRKTGDLKVGEEYLFISYDGSYALRLKAATKRGESDTVEIVSLKDSTMFPKDENGEFYPEALNNLLSSDYVWKMASEDPSKAMFRNNKNGEYLAWAKNGNTTRVLTVDNDTAQYTYNEAYNRWDWKVGVDMYTGYAYNGDEQVYSFMFCNHAWTIGKDFMEVDTLALTGDTLTVKYLNNNYSDFYTRFINSKEMKYPIPTDVTCFWRVYLAKEYDTSQKNCYLNRVAEDSVIYHTAA